MNVKQGATEPHPKANLEAPPGQPLPLANAVSIRFRMTDYNTGATKVDAAASVANAETGTAEYFWGINDTDTIGLYRAEWYVVMADGKRWKIPSNGTMYVRVLPSP